MPDPTLTALFLGDYDRDATYRIVRPAGTRNWLLMATAGGAGRVVVGDAALRCRPGSLVALRPGTPHDYATDPVSGRWIFAWAHVRPPAEWTPLLAWTEALPGVLLAPPCAEPVWQRTVALLREGAAIEAAGGPFARDLARLRLHEALIIRAAAAGAAGPAIDPRLARVVTAIAADPAVDHGVAALAAIAGMSPDHFAHRFRAALGRSPAAYVEERRMQAAARLLERPEVTVVEVAAAVGFANPGHFATRFRRWAGISPRAWRNRGG